MGDKVKEKSECLGKALGHNGVVKTALILFVIDYTCLYWRDEHLNIFSDILF